MISLSGIKKESKTIYIDVNCDLGQSYGIYKNDLELEMLPYVSSVNISCGSHSGDPSAIINAINVAKENNLAIGAHIGYPDIQGFGYRPMDLSQEELQALVLYQLGALSSLCKAYSVDLNHVRAHGALYVKMANDIQTSVTIAQTIKKVNPWLVLVGASSEVLNKTAEITDIKIAPELLLDKKFNFDGSIDFESGSVVDKSYSEKILYSVINHSTAPNKEGGFSKVNIRTVHLNSSSPISKEIAKMVMNYIPQPVPVNVSIIDDKSWV